MFDKPRKQWLEKFKGSNVGEKREMMNFVYSNLSLKGKNLEYSMRSPFKDFTECSNIKEWSDRRDLNPRPHAPHACALPDCATVRGDIKIILQKYT